MNDVEYINFLENYGVSSIEMTNNTSVLYEFSSCSCNNKDKKTVKNTSERYGFLSKKLNYIKENLEEMMSVYTSGFQTNDLIYESSLDFDTNKKIAIDYIQYLSNSISGKDLIKKVQVYFENTSEEEFQEIMRESLFKLVDEMKIIDEQILILKEDTNRHKTMEKKIKLQKMLETNLNNLIHFCKK